MCRDMKRENRHVATTHSCFAGTLIASHRPWHGLSMSRYWIIYKLTLRREDTRRRHFSVVKNVQQNASAQPMWACTLHRVQYFHTLLGERAWKEPSALQTAGTRSRCILPNNTTGRGEGGYSTQPIQIETREGKKEGAMQTFKMGA